MDLFDIPSGFRVIPRADSRYVVSDNGHVFNMKTGRMLKQHWNGYSTYTIIKDPVGKQFRFNHLKMLLKPYVELTKEWVMNKDGAKIIPNFPDYAISHYGAVYRINPPKRGPQAGKVFMVSELTKKGFPYVRLQGTKNPRQVRLDKLVEQVWGSGSTYQY